MDDVIIQLTGGIDSTVLAYYLKEKYRLHGVSINYNYAPQYKEMELVKDLTKNLSIELKIIDFSSYIKSFNLPPISTMNYLIKYQFLIEILATLSAYPDFDTLFVGWLKGEWNNKKEIIDKLQQLLRIKIIAPFSDITKSEVIKIGNKLGIDFSKTWSCIVSGKIHCGICVPCRSRKMAFKEAKIKDPTSYYYNMGPDQIDEFAKKLSFEEFYEKYLKPFLKYTNEYTEEFVYNYVNIMKKYSG